MKGCLLHSLFVPEFCHDVDSILFVVVFVVLVRSSMTKDKGASVLRIGKGRIVKRSVWVDIQDNRRWKRVDNLLSPIQLETPWHWPWHYCFPEIGVVVAARW